ncbi:hypothetical protein PFISCL1PPCAC_19213 [Pristionchus fissidentatus]|uniref:F-box domain-containing protein n=1 Tax=Pristionchus fissidentatus TaxID=1538716 RepID=A0AAV5W6W3_9BILA|nr:hypothetical protein PFISCL1PPCAC_19213 [Pristionchus fissidentatus]
MACISDSPTAKKSKVEEQIQVSLLDLPNELISHIFSFLNIRDRFVVRVNKKLSEIESKMGKMKTSILEVKQVPLDNVSLLISDVDSDVVYDVDEDGLLTWTRDVWHKPSLLAILKKLSQISIFDILEITMFDGLLVREDRKLAAAVMKIESSRLCIWNGNQTMTRSLFFENSRIRDSIAIICACRNLRVSAVHRVYQGMENRSIRLRQLKVVLNNDHFELLLKLIDPNCDRFERFHEGLLGRHKYFYHGHIKITERMHTDLIDIEYIENERKINEEKANLLRNGYIQDRILFE